MSKGSRVSTSLIGVAGVWIWIAIFSAGLLLDSRPYRSILDPSIDQARGSEADEAPVQPAVLAGSIAPVSAPGPREADAVTPQAAVDTWLWAFLGSILLFTPLNAALLSILAALVGGCASWLAHHDDKIPDSLSADEKARLEHKLRFLTESPLTAMIRGFAVYLAVIAGVYIVGGDPFQDGSPGQYVRFVGTVSLVAFVTGYDPTRLQQMIEGIPLPGKK